VSQNGEERPRLGGEEGRSGGAGAMPSGGT